jgi:Ni/Co efflux regulator RcnB
MEEPMAHSWKIALTFAASAALIGGVASAQPDHGRPGGPGHAAPSRAGPVRAAPEPHAGPRGYVRPAPPAGWNARPAAADRGAYQHNFQAARTYQIGPYHPPRAGWVARRWAYGQILPRYFWSSQYILGDYWLFGLEVPPVGFEWVRYGTDALLIDVNTGSILQVEYGVFG